MRLTTDALLCFNVITLSFEKARCEAILRTNPSNRDTAETHLACIEAAEAERERKAKRAAVEGTIGMAAVGLAVGVAGLLLKKR